jgi:hypothetical protein
LKDQNYSFFCEIFSTKTAKSSTFFFSKGGRSVWGVNLRQTGLWRPNQKTCQSSIFADRADAMANIVKGRIAPEPDMNLTRLSQSGRCGIHRAGGSLGRVKGKSNTGGPSLGRGFRGKFVI